MKRSWWGLFALLFLLTGCSAGNGSALAARAKRDKSRLTAAAEEMRAMGAERIYVAMEAPEETRTESGTEETGKPAEGIPRPVRYVKASDTREEVESEVLEGVLNDYGFALILFQTAADGRESVIFSTGKEADAGLVRGVAFSFDGEPVAWWGRSASLIRHKGRYVEINPKGDAWYYTVSLGDGLWYWEKSGTVLG